MSARRNRAYAGFLGHFRYSRPDAAIIRGLAAEHLRSGLPILGQVTTEARWYLLAKAQPAPLEPRKVLEQLSELETACDTVLERLMSLSDEARSALWMQAATQRLSDYTNRVRGLGENALLVGDLAEQAQQQLERERDGSRYRPRDSDRAFRDRLAQIWVASGGPLLPFSRDVLRQGEPFRGPLADFLRACMAPLVGGHDLENLFEELRRARVNR